MYKINKCLTLTRTFTRVSIKRRLSCGDKCPPRYECKQPEQSQFEKEIEEVKKMSIPSLFVPRCPKDPRIYKNLLLFVFFPAIICLLLNMRKGERPRPKFVEFSYMRIRNKPWPWKDPVRSLFHNPRNNALPTGYEIEVPEDEEYDPFEPDKK